MNKERREELWDVYGFLDDAMGRIIDIRSDEQDCFDNLPDGLQASRTGESIQEAIDWLDGIESDIQNVRDKVEKFIKNKK